MSHHQPPPYPPQMPGPPYGYAPPWAPEVSARYRRWAGILRWLAIIIGAFVVVALVASVVLLVVADRDERNAPLGYLALVLWAGILVMTPVLLAVGLSAAAMTRRVRQQRRTGTPP
ncbi:hypothetical protein [Streptomyces mayteni]